jgi:hypothetical protein
LLNQPTTRELAAEQSAEARTTRRLVMTGVMLAIFMVATDSYIVATAMPTIVADLAGFASLAGHLPHFFWPRR